MKKQGIGTWITLAALILTIVGFVLYGAAVKAGDKLAIASGSEFFYDMTRPEDVAMGPAVVTGSILAIVFLAAGLVLSQLTLDGIAGKVVKTVAGILRIAAPAMLVIAVFYFLYGSFSGLGWTFFSNEELTIYPEATAVGTQVITAVVIYIVAMIASAVAAYFDIPKKDAE